MLSITKFIGVIIVFFGVVLLMSCYESTDKEPLDVIALGLVGLLVTVIGVVCWMWDEPYSDNQD